MLSHRTRSKELPKGLDAAWDMAAGFARQMVTRTRHFLRQAEPVIAMEDKFKDLADAKLRAEAMAFRDVFRRGRETTEDLVRAFAVVREVAARRLGERPFPVQVAGAGS